MNTLQEMRQETNQKFDQLSQETNQNIEQLRQENRNFQQNIIERIEAVEQFQENMREEMAELRRMNGSNVSSSSTF